MKNTEWKKADNPPKTKHGFWSKDVVVVTNYGDVFSLAYFGGGRRDEGVWQRPTRFDDGEEVEFWTEKPEDVFKNEIEERALLLAAGEIPLDGLYQCPYEKATKCKMTDPCNGCENWAAAHVNSNFCKCGQIKHVGFDKCINCLDED